MSAGRRQSSLSIVALATMLALLLLPMPAWGAAGRGSRVLQRATDFAGLRASPFDASLVKRPPALTGAFQAVLPSAVDLSAWVPPVRAQLRTSSCGAWASTYYARTIMEKKEHPSWDLTDPRYQFSTAWTYNQTNNGGMNSGSYFSDVVRLLALRGATDMAEMPFDDGDVATRPLRRQLQAARPYRIRDYGAFWVEGQGPVPDTTPTLIDDLKAWVAAGNPAVLLLTVREGSPFAGGEPVHFLDGEEGFIEGNHAVCIVGYDDDANPAGAGADHRGGFRVVNSYGPDWNGPDKGFIYLSYHYVKQNAYEAWWMEDAGPDAPVLDSISVDQANAGGVVTLSGRNFGALRAAARVSFNGVDAPLVGWSNERVTAMVPQAATSGPLTLYDWEGTATASLPFVVGGLEAGGAFIDNASPATCSVGTTVTVSAQGGDFGADIQLYLVDETGLWIPASAQDTSGTTAISGVFDLRGVLPGAYTVAVGDAEGSQAVSRDALVVTDAVDTLEPNDSLETAHGPVRSGTTHSAYISVLDDRDYYKVKVPRRRATITATLSGIPEVCDYGLRVCDASGKALASTTSRRPVDQAVLQARVRAGTYYVLVSQSWNLDRFQPYLLKVTVR